MRTNGRLAGILVVLVGCGGGHAAAVPGHATGDGSDETHHPTTPGHTTPPDTTVPTDPTDTGTTPTTATAGSCETAAGPWAIVDGTAGYADLGDALAAASDGSEIVVCPGTYTGAFAASVPVKLHAYAALDTTILAGAGDTVLAVPGGSEVVGLTLRGGDGVHGGGLRVTGPGDVLVQACAISDNAATDGGGLYVDGANVTVVDTEISANDAGEGGGGAAVVAGGTLDLTAGGVLRRNSAGGWGGGAWVDDAHLVGGTVTENLLPGYSYPYYYGGAHQFPRTAYSGAGVATSGISDLTGVLVTRNVGIYAGGLSVTGGETTLVDTAIDGNAVYQLGGGVAVWGGSLVLEGTSAITGNVSYEAGGGAIVVDGTLTGGEVAGNAGSERGGGLYVVSGSAVDVWVHDNQADVGGGLYGMGAVAGTGLLLEANRAGQGGGAAVESGVGDYYPEETRLTLTDCEISANEADEGAGIYSGRALVVVDTVVADNAGNHGAGVFVTGEVTRFTRGAIVRNVAQAEGGGAHVLEDGVLILEDADLGEGADDNAPADIRVGALDFAYGIGTSVTCAAGTCAP